MMPLGPLVRRVAVSLPFRVAVAIGCLYFHVAMMTRIGHDRFEYEFNADPDHAPLFYHPQTDGKPDKWDRLLPSRWDAQHYQSIALRGYSWCKHPWELQSGEYPDDARSCELAFYPTYGWLGGIVMKVAHLPVDYALFYLSLGASFLFLVMWTSRPMVEALGLGTAYLSLLLLNVFDTGYTLVTVQTEPCVLALTLGAFLCLHRRWLLVGAILAGATTAIRISGVATGFAFCGALLVLTLREHPRPRWVWAWRAALMAVSGWGIMALMAYYWHRFGDPLIYAHAHERAFRHHASLTEESSSPTGACSSSPSGPSPTRASSSRRGCCGSRSGTARASWASRSRGRRSSTSSSSGSSASACTARWSTRTEGTRAT